MEQEIWKDIKGYEGLYQVSNLGNVIKITKRKVKTVTQVISQFGYIHVCLCKEGKPSRYSVHRLVAEAFIPNPNNLSQINHINGNKTNNRVSNLEWISPKDNIKHAYDNKLRPTRKILCIETNRIFDSVKECAEWFNASSGTISNYTRDNRKYKGIYTLKYIDDIGSTTNVSLICNETGEIFKSITYAADKIGISRYTMCNHLNTGYPKRIGGLTYSKL